MFDRLRAMLIKEFIQVFRDPRMRITLFIIPALQTIIFGYAVNMDVKNIPTAILDRDNSSESRELVATMISSGHFHLIDKIGHDSEARMLLDRGSVRVVVVIEHGLSELLRRGGSAPVQVLLDGTDSNTAGVIMGYLARLASTYNANIQNTYTARHLGQGPRIGRVGVGRTGLV